MTQIRKIGNVLGVCVLVFMSSGSLFHLFYINIIRLGKIKFSRPKQTQSTIALQHRCLVLNVIFESLHRFQRTEEGQGEW